MYLLPREMTSTEMVFWVANRAMRYFFLTLLTLIGVFHFFYSVLSFPIKLVSPTIYRKFVSAWLLLTVPGFLCVPFSWLNARVYINGLQRMKKCQGENLLLLANHSGRIDWIFGLFIGSTYYQRVGFITEAFIMFLPFLGWHRYLVEDMFVFRSFKRDRDRLVKNIDDFNESNVPRWIFLCPEGHIADFNPSDQKYISDCEEFSKSQGLHAFEMVLTPRYKGMQCFNRLLTKGDPTKKALDLSVAMTYVQNGKKLLKPLRSRDRVIPDLWILVQGNLECHVHCHDLEMSNDPADIKTQIMKDYELKDRVLKQFYETGRFPDAYPGKSIAESPEGWRPAPDLDKPLGTIRSNKSSIRPEDMAAALKGKKVPEGTQIAPDAKDYFQRLPCNHLQANLSFFGQFLFWYMFLSYLNMMYIVMPICITLYCLLVVSHVAGEIMAEGQSRESLPFEGVLKAIMFRFQGIEGVKKVDVDSKQVLNTANFEGDD